MIHDMDGRLAHNAYGSKENVVVDCRTKLTFLFVFGLNALPMTYLDSLLIKIVLSYFNIKGTLRNMLDYAVKKK